MTGAALTHQSVMLGETLAAVAARDGGIYADVTAGRGGHTRALLDQSGPTGRVLAIDRDHQAVEAVRASLGDFGGRLSVVQGPFSQVASIVRATYGRPLDGLIADLGVSSPQLDDPARGFSFKGEGPLDMRMDVSSGPSVADFIAGAAESELADVIYKYGEERRSRPIARSIRRAFEAGDLRTTADLRRAVVRVTGPKRGRVDPATRTFQALRIAVNDELGELQALLDALCEVLAEGAVAAIIAFHSLEDRLVKHAFRQSDCLSPLFKRPLVAGEAEQAANPRARSAKFRAARRVARQSVGDES